MHRLLFHTAGLCLALVMGLVLAHGSELGDSLAKSGPAPESTAPPTPILKDKGEATCGSHGTRVEFVDTPSKAAKIAKKEEKLVFVLHVSGNFEDPRFT